MNTKEFKNLLKESIISGGSSLLEIKGSEEARSLYKGAFYYALKKYAEFWKVAYGEDTQLSDLERDEFAKEIKANFRKDLKDLRLNINNEKRWRPLFDKYHQQYEDMTVDGSVQMVSDALWNILKLKMEKADEEGMDFKEYGEFSEKKISRLADTINKATQEIDGASQELTSENLLLLLKYYMFQDTLEDPKTMERLHGSFGAFVKSTLESFYNAGDGRNIKQLYNGLLELLSKSPLYTSGGANIVKTMLKKEMQKTLFTLDNLMNKRPHGYDFKDNVEFMEKAIEDYEKGSQALNEALQREDIQEYLESFLPFAKKRLGYDKDPEINFTSDPQNGKLTLGKTAYYEPQSMSVTVFTDNRHPKDIMRSLSHELVHHAQNCDGQFDTNLGVGEGYAQNDKHLRKMEEDAYLRGNMCFRDWEDGFKQTQQLAEHRKELYHKLLRRFI
tara:strand:+ start:363 stop:1697 length:1335 start_codon:yes stop_codon:yes gene_type:complete